MKRKLTFAYLGMVSGFVVLMLLSHSLWLEMRLNTALVLPLFTAAGFILSFFSPRKAPPVVLIFLQGSVILLILLSYDFDFGAIAVMPAIWLREGFLIHSLGIREANGILAGVMILGNLALVTFRGCHTSSGCNSVEALQPIERCCQGKPPRG